MKLKLFSPVILLVLISLQVCAQSSVNEHGKQTPAVTNEVQAKFNLIDANLDEKASKNYNVTMVTNDYSIPNNPSEIYAVDTTISSITLNLPLISTLPYGGKAIITISDFTGNSSINSITIMTNGSDTIQGSSSFLINTGYATITLMAIPNVNYWILK